MRSPYFAVMTGNSHQAFAGLARPAHRVHAFQNLAGLGIENLVDRGALGVLARGGVDHVGVAMVGQAQ